MGYGASRAVWHQLMVWKIAAVLAPINFLPETKCTLVALATQKAIDEYSLLPSARVAKLHRWHGDTKRAVLEALVKQAANVLEVDIGVFAIGLPNAVEEGIQNVQPLETLGIGI